MVSLLREALDVFGAERCLYGGDWPVMNLATTYADWFAVVGEALAGHPAATVDAVMRANAERVYSTTAVLPIALDSTGKA
jgi:L-fuconolactonase